MSEYKNYLTCKRVRFRCLKDEDAFFEWIKKIKCIKSFEGAGDELYLDLVDRKLKESDLRELMALLYRYDIDMKQMARFLTSKNRNWFFDNKTAYWHKRVFGAQENSKNSKNK